jgi:broad specificity phosphatase PhoE
MPVILLIRHAQASYGAVDYDVLSDLGHRQAAVLDSTLVDRAVTPAIVISGPARRQHHTARLCERTLGNVGVAQDGRWAEYDTDDVLARYADRPVRLDGTRDASLSSQEFQVILDAALAEWLQARDRDSLSRQTWPRYLEQVSRALRDLAAKLESGQTALVFTSAGAIAAVCLSVLGLPATSFVALNRVQVNTGITKIVHGRRGTSLVSFNEHGHLEEADRVLVTSR